MTDHARRAVEMSFTDAVHHMLNNPLPPDVLSVEQQADIDRNFRAFEADRMSKGIARLRFNDATDHAALVTDLMRAWEDRYFVLTPRLRPVLRRAKARYRQGRRIDFTLARRVAQTEAVREILRMPLKGNMPVITVQVKGKKFCEVTAGTTGKLRMDSIPGSMTNTVAQVTHILTQVLRSPDNAEPWPDDAPLVSLSLGVTGIIVHLTVHYSCYVTRDGWESYVEPMAGDSGSATFLRAAACYMKWELSPGREVPDVVWQDPDT